MPQDECHLIISLDKLLKHASCHKNSLWQELRNKSVGYRRRDQVVLPFAIHPLLGMSPQPKFVIFEQSSVQFVLVVHNFLGKYLHTIRHYLLQFLFYKLPCHSRHSLPDNSNSSKLSLTFICRCRVASSGAIGDRIIGSISLAPGAIFNAALGDGRRSRGRYGHRLVLVLP